MTWLWITLWIILGLTALSAAIWFGFYFFIRMRYYPMLRRIFVEKPLFVVPRGEPTDDAEEVSLTTTDGFKLAASYFRSTQDERRGVILFGLEYSSTRWACLPYCQFLRDAGFDVFCVDFRNQGDSEHMPGYEPLQWVSNHDVSDMQAALAYLKSRPDAKGAGIGFFGISKGAAAGLLAAVRDDSVRCFVTDGLFGIHTTMVPYMRRWVAIYSTRVRVQRFLPDWYYRMFAKLGLKEIGRDRQCHFLALEEQIHRLGPRPLLMIHGAADNYIRPDMARQLHDMVTGPKELWLVDKAKHNQSLQTATTEYQRRVLEFFEKHLVGDRTAQPKLASAALANEPAFVGERNT